MYIGAGRSETVAALKATSLRIVRIVSKWRQPEKEAMVRRIGSWAGMSGDVCLLVMRDFLAAVVVFARVIQQNLRCVNDPNKVNLVQVICRNRSVGTSLWVKWPGVERRSLA